MARDSRALEIVRWAIDPTADLLRPADLGIDPAVGFPPSYSQPGGDEPDRELFNLIWSWFTTGIKELQERGGVLEWDARQEFVHPALCTGSDEVIYASVRSSGPSGTTQDPTTDSTETFWRKLIDSSTGRIRFATSAELDLGNAADLPIAPATLLAALFGASPDARWRASTTEYGLGRLGTQAEINADDPDALVTGATLGARLTAALMNAGADGVLASAALDAQNRLVLTLSDGTVLRVPFTDLISGLISGVTAGAGLLGGGNQGAVTLRVDFASGSQTEAGTSGAQAVSPSGLLSLFKAAPNGRWHATSDRYGLVRFGTQAEIDSDSASRGVTGATLAGRLTGLRTILANSFNLQSRVEFTNNLAERLDAFRWIEVVVRAPSGRLTTHQIPVAASGLLAPRTTGDRVYLIARSLNIVEGEDLSLYSVNLGTGRATWITQIRQTSTSDTSAGSAMTSDVNGDLIVLYDEAGVGVMDTVYRINPLTGAVTNLGRLEAASLSTSMGFARHSGNFYLTFGSTVHRIPGGAGGAFPTFSFGDSLTDIGRAIGSLGLSVGGIRGVGLTSHAGQLLTMIEGSSGSSGLRVVSTANGRAGNRIGGQPNISGSDLALVSANGNLYGFFRLTGGESALQQINPSTGVITTIGSFRETGDPPVGPYPGNGFGAAAVTAPAFPAELEVSNTETLGILRPNNPTPVQLNFLWQGAGTLQVLQVVGIR